MDAGLGFILFTTLIAVSVMSYFIIMGRINYYKNKWLDEKYWLDALKEQYRTELDKEIKQAVQKSLNTQRAIVKGHVAETLFPLISERLGGYKAADMMFTGGNLVDYLIFSGYAEALDGKGKIDEVVFCDIKTGNAKLLPHQQQLKDTIRKGNVKWMTLRIDDNGEMYVE